MNFFRRKNQVDSREVTFEQQLVEQQVAPGTELRYDGKLIERFRGHHEALVDIAAKATRAAQGSRFADAQRHMSRFKQVFNEHLLEKNLRLYTYLSCCLKTDPEGLELTRDMRRETADISRVATRFIQQCNDAGINEENKAAFLEQLAHITEVLNECFAREERTLYSMYQPPQAYQRSATTTRPVDVGQRIQTMWAEAC